MASKIQSLIVRYGLTEEDVNTKITDMHIGDISRSWCSQWKSLRARLGLDPIVANDIDRLTLKEEEKRSTFLTTWREKKGCEATYKALISALLAVECRHEAESVCELLEGGLVKQKPKLQEQAVSSTAPLNTRLTTSDSGTFLTI